MDFLWKMEAAPVEPSEFEEEAHREKDKIDPLSKSCKQSLILAACTAEAILLDEDMDEILGAGVRYFHAKTAEEAEGCIMDMIRTLEQSQLTIQAKARLCLYVLARRVKNPANIPGAFTDGLR